MSVSWIYLCSDYLWELCVLCELRKAFAMVRRVQEDCCYCHCLIRDLSQNQLSASSKSSVVLRKATGKLIDHLYQYYPQNLPKYCEFVISLRVGKKGEVQIVESSNKAYITTITSTFSCQR